MIFTKTIFRLLAFGLVTLSISLAADDFDGVRGLYLSTDHPTILGMRFDIVWEGADGFRNEVPVSHNFHSGERFWLQMDVRTRSWVYVVNRTISGDEKGIILIREADRTKRPAASERPRLVLGAQALVPGAKRLFPDTGKALAFDDQTGTETLYVILSDHPLGLEHLFDHSGLAHEAHLGELDDKLLSWSRNATVAVPVEGAKGFALTDTNAYCVQKRPNEPVMIEITLRHSH